MDFGGDPSKQFPAYDGQQYTLYKETWDKKIAKSEREHLKYNSHWIADTLLRPDKVRASRQNIDCKMLYKKTDVYNVREGITAPSPPGGIYFVVVINTKHKIINTFYPTSKIG